MMSRWGRRDGVRLTHLPTGLYVEAWCDHLGRRVSPWSPALMQRARSLLASKLWAHRQAKAERPVRSYTLIAGLSTAVRQGGMVLMRGPIVHDLLRDGTGLDGVMAAARRHPV